MAAQESERMHAIPVDTLVKFYQGSIGDHEDGLALRPWGAGAERAIRRRHRRWHRCRRRRLVFTYQMDIVIVTYSDNAGESEQESGTQRPFNLADYVHSLDAVNEDATSPTYRGFTYWTPPVDASRPLASVEICTVDDPFNAQTGRFITYTPDPTNQDMAMPLDPDDLLTGAIVEVDGAAEDNADLMEEVEEADGVGASRSGQQRILVAIRAYTEDGRNNLFLGVCPTYQKIGDAGDKLGTSPGDIHLDVGFVDVMENAHSDHPPSKLALMDDRTAWEMEFSDHGNFTLHPRYPTNNNLVLCRQSLVDGKRKLVLCPDQKDTVNAASKFFYLGPDRGR